MEQQSLSETFTQIGPIITQCPRSRITYYLGPKQYVIRDLDHCYHNSDRGHESHTIICLASRVLVNFFFFLLFFNFINLFYKTRQNVEGDVVRVDLMRQVSQSSRPDDVYLPYSVNSDSYCTFIIVIQFTLLGVDYEISITNIAIVQLTIFRNRTFRRVHFQCTFYEHFEILVQSLKSFFILKFIILLYFE